MDHESLEHMDWLVKKRSQNQDSALALFKLLHEEREFIYASRKMRMRCQLLIAINFSLWRAVFLAKIAIDRTTMMEQAERFLVKLIESNMITYAIDFESNAFSYRYYLLNARTRLEKLEAIKLLPKGLLLPIKELEGNPKLWWEDNQKAFERAVERFSEEITAEKD